MEDGWLELLPHVLCSVSHVRCRMEVKRREGGGGGEGMGMGVGEGV